MVKLPFLPLHPDIPPLLPPIDRAGGIFQKSVRCQQDITGHATTTCQLATMARTSPDQSHHQQPCSLSGIGGQSGRFVHSRQMFATIILLGLSYIGRRWCW